MKFYSFKTYEEMCHKAATLISSVMVTKPNAVLGLATGSTPIGIYKELVELNKKGDITFKDIKSVNLDEYCGLDGSHDQSYRYFMNTNLFNHVDIDKNNTYVPSGVSSDLKSEGEAYDKMIKDFGGIDIQLLGIGLDGHIGFNEPAPFFTKETHVVDLHESTIKANARFFNSEDEVPKKAITMGMMSIMQAKKVLLVANGKAKKEILEKSIYGEITPEVPASILQLHPDLTVIYSEE